MVKVEEDPFGSDLVTQYGYGALNNLTTVTQVQTTPAANPDAIVRLQHARLADERNESGSERGG